MARKRTFNRDSAEARILKFATDNYPCTAEDARKALRMRPDTFNMALKNLVKDGYIILDELPDKVFLRPTLKGMQILGVKQTIKTKLKKDRRKKKKSDGDEDLGVMYL